VTLPRSAAPILLVSLLLTLACIALAPAAGANPLAPSLMACDGQGHIFDLYIMAVGPAGSAPSTWFAWERCALTGPVDEIAALMPAGAPLFVQTGHESGSYAVYSGGLMTFCEPPTSQVADGLCITGLESAGGMLYAVVGPRACGAGSLDRFDQVSGSFTPIGSTGMVSLRGLAWDPLSGSGLYSLAYGPTTCDESGIPDLVRIDPATGAATVIGSTGVQNLISLSFASGFLIGGSGSLDGGNLYLIDTASGAARLIGDHGTEGPEIRGLTPFGGLIVPVRPSSWGQLKSIYR